MPLALLSLGLATVVACQKWDPDNDVEGMQPLAGAHRTAPCEACHATRDPFSALVVTCDGERELPLDVGNEDCLACHGCERPQSGDPSCDATEVGIHANELSCGNDGCHTFADAGWDDKCGGGTVIQGCDNGCHGVPTNADGSPQDASHVAHLGTTKDTVSDGVGGFEPYSCDVCHPAGGVGALSHDDDVLDVPLTGFGTLDAVGGTCTVSCHGDGVLTYSLLAPPAWNGPALGCEGCHGYPPAGGHPPLDTCSTGGCHSVTGGSNESFVPGDVNRHIDGVLDR